MKRSKGFTLIELLVVIGIIALLVAILMPALSKAKEMAKQIQCASQQNSIGKAMYMYMGENKGSMPTTKTAGVTTYGNAGGIQLYGTANTPKNWYTLDDKTWDWSIAKGNVGGCLYLLVKYEDLVPKMFLCPSSPNDEEMSMQTALDANPAIQNWSDMQGFASLNNLSYSYHDPYGTAAVLDDSSSSGLVVMADKSHAFAPGDGTLTPNIGTGPVGFFDNDWTDQNSPDAHGNTINHRTQVQNVLFMDSHVKKYSKPNVGVADDNIYSHWPATTANDVQKQNGQWGGGNALHMNDTYLVN